MNDISVNADLYDAIANNLIENITEVNKILCDCRIKSKILESNFNVREILSSDFENVVVKNQSKYDYYDLDKVDKLFAQFAEMKSEEDAKKQPKKSQGTADSSAEELQSILDGIKVSLESLTNEKVVLFDNTKYEERTDKIRNNFHHLAFELEKICNDLKNAVGHQNKAADPTGKNPLDEKFNGAMEKLNKVRL